MGNDFASFYKRRAIRAYFDKQREAGVYGAEHEEMVKSWVGKVADSASAN